jgi:phage repressor protein C with HTH and peptisase S24 domain
MEKMELRSILERVDALQRTQGISDYQLSIQSGMSADGIRNWRRRVKDGGGSGGAHARSLAMVAETLGVSIEHLSLGAENTAPAKKLALNPRHDADLWRLPVYDIDAPAGDGPYVTDDDPIYEIAFSPKMLSGLTNATNNELAVLQVRGDSMSPTLVDGDQVLVDVTKKNINYDGVFLLRYDDALRIKRIDKNPSTNHFLVKSDNPIYDPFEVEAENLDVVGRVVWVGRRL